MPLFEKFRFLFYLPTDYNPDLNAEIRGALHAIFDGLSQCDCRATTDPYNGNDVLVYFLTSYEERIDELIRTVEPTCHNLSCEPIFRGIEVYRKSTYDGVFRWKWYYEDLYWFDQPGLFDQPWLFGVVE